MEKITLLESMRVAVVDTENSEEEISQSLTFEQIMSLDEDLMRLYSLPEYFQLQNDDMLGLHYSFLIDIKNKTRVS